MLAIGIDLGGTKTNFGLIEIRKEDFKIRKSITIASPQTKEAIITALKKNIRNLWDKKLEKIGLALAGRIDLEKKVSILSPNLKALEQITFSRLLSQEFNLPVFINNDASAFTLAESCYGAARAKQKVVGLTLGTGIGGGLVISGKLWEGAYTSASEIGHMVIDCNGRLCSCGQEGCFEAYASATAIIKEYEQRCGFKKDAYSIYAEAEANLEPACSVFAEASNYLAVGLSNIINVLEPEIIVLGGGLARAKKLILPAIQKTKKITLPRGEKIKIVKAKLGIKAGMIGAALLGYNSALS